MMTTPNSGADIKDPANGNVVGTVPAMPAGGWPLVILVYSINLSFTHRLSGHLLDMLWNQVLVLYSCF